MKDVIFVNSVDKYKNLKSLHTPMGILSLATKLNISGYLTEIIDFNYLYLKGKIDLASDTNIDKMAKFILDKEPKIVSFYTMCNSFHNAILIATRLKEMNPEITILFGGPQSTLTAKETLEALDCVDIIGVGEGEATIVGLVEAIIQDKNLDDIKGIAYRKNGVIVINKMELISCLDTLHEVDYTLIPIEDYDTIAIDAGRGCPFGCTFCSTKTFWERKFRLKGTDRLISEMKYLYEVHGKTKFDMVHDLFTANKAKVIEFCKKFIDEGMDIQWSCSARVDTLDEEVITWLKKAGCRKIYLGIETGSQRMQSLINKRLKLDDTKERIQVLMDCKMEVTLSFIYGFYGEKVQDVRDTLDMILTAVRLGVKDIQLHKYTVLVGTEMYDLVKDVLLPMENNTDIVDSINIERSQELIQKHPNLFPHFYTFSTEVRDTYDLLDRFVNFIFIRMRKHYPGTFNRAIRHYGDDLLKLYDDFVGLNREDVINLFCNDDYFFSDRTQVELNVEISELLEKWVNGTDDAWLKEVFRFERDCYNYLHVEKRQDEVAFTYNVDVIKLKKTNFEDKENIKKATKVLFYRSENDRLRIRRIA